MLARAEAAVKAGGGTIRALLWYHGEGDGDLRYAVLYKTRLKNLFNNVRSNLGFSVTVNVNVSEGTELVRKAQVDTIVELQQVGCVDAKGLEISLDNLHLTTAAQVKRGAMMIEAFLRISTNHSLPAQLT
ncbi:hypothetical protein ACS0TY_005937 [Phlomoides rotata]